MHLALAVISFVYFNFYGMKTFGFFQYFKNLCPSGVPGPMKPVIWFLELFSMVIRVLTLAVRLYGNMLAGHMMLAIFSIATTCFIQTALFSGSMDLIAGLPSIAWFALLVVMYASSAWLLSSRRSFSRSCRLPMYPPRCTRTKPRSFGIDRRVVKPPALRGAHA